MQRTMVLRFSDHSSEAVHEGEEGLDVPLLGRVLDRLHGAAGEEEDRREAL